MYGIEVVVDKTGCIVINVNKEELIKHMGSEITTLAKQQQSSPEELNNALQNLLRTQVKFGIIK